MPSFPRLKLAHKGLLIVIVPVITQLLLYLELKHEIDAVQRQAAAQEYSRNVMVDVNSLILESSKLFEAYVNLWIVHNNKLAAKTEPLTRQVRGQIDELVALLMTHKEDEKAASQIRDRGDKFLKALAGVKLTMAESGSPLTMFDALEMHQDFGETSRGLMTALQDLGTEHTERVTSARNAETQARQYLLFFCDVAAVVTLAMAFVLASSLKNATGQLDESHKKLQAVIDTVPMAIIICHDDGTIESMNQAGSVLFGYQLDDVVKKNVSLLFENATLSKWLEESREHHQVQTEAVSQAKEVVPVELSVMQFQSPKGPRLLLTVMDITERFKMERMKRDFIAMVSHDIRSPLTSISACMDLIKQRDVVAKDEAASDWVNTAQVSADRLLSMVTKLLDLERLDSGVFNFDLAEFSLNDAIEAAWQATRSPTKNIKVKLPDESVRVYADRESIEHVLQNFFSNAIKFSPDESVIVCSVTRADGTVKVAVTDQGPGVPERYRETIFDRFKQAPQGRGRKDGTGLGLAICKSMVQALGGHIGVESNSPSGSTFWFTIPDTVRAILQTTESTTVS